MNANSKLKEKKCKGCGDNFMPMRPLQSVCSPMCAVKVAQTLRMKQERKELREAKQRIKSRAEWLKEAQSEVNRYVRLRDKDLPCISCGRFHNGQYHAGHYRTVGSAPELRFELSNIHKQCAPCNNHLSGNIVNYRMRLVEKIGEEVVEWLEGKHEPLKLTIPEIIAIRDKYRLLCKAIQKESEDG